MTKTERLGHANALIEVISRHGRRFFWRESTGRLARLELDARGRVWLIDDYTGKRIYTHHTSGRWSGFSHGGTLRGLVEGMRNYIITGAPMHRDYIAPERITPGSNIWGYSADAAAAVRAEAFQLPMFEQRAAAQKGTND